MALTDTVPDAGAVSRPGWSARERAWDTLRLVVSSAGPGRCEFALTNACNANCGFCNFARDTLSKDRWEYVERKGALQAIDILFHQDIRYHRSDQKGTGGKAWRAVRGVFVTQGDRCGCDQFNASFLLGGLTASAIAQPWRREEDRTPSKIFTSWGTHVAVKIFTNLLTEFIGGQ